MMRIKSLILGSIAAAALACLGAPSVMAADSPLDWSSPSSLMITASPATTADFQGAIKDDFNLKMLNLAANDPLGSAGLWDSATKFVGVGYSIQALPLASPISSKETVDIGMIAAVTSFGPSSCVSAGGSDKVFYGDSGPLGHAFTFGTTGWSGSTAIPANTCTFVAPPTEPDFGV